MEIASAMLANHAEIEGDKLYVSGGAWAWVQVPALPHSFTIQLAQVLIAEPEDGIDAVLVRVFVIDPSGTATYGNELNVAWPQAEVLKPGQPAVVPVVIHVPVTVTRAGRHSLAVFLDYDGSSRRSVPFTVVEP